LRVERTTEAETLIILPGLAPLRDEEIFGGFAASTGPILW
jgi:hypothetical protein